MKIGAKQLTILAAIVWIGAATQALAAGDKNGYNKPADEPGEETYLTPYANDDGGRMSLFCAQDEKLVVTPVDGSAVAVTCVPPAD